MKLKLPFILFAILFSGNISGQWIQRATFPGESRAKATSFLIGDTIYMMGGVDNSGIILHDFWTYSIPSNAWTQKTNFPGEERYGATGFVISDKGYVATGGNDNGFLDDLWQYNPATGTWVQKTGLPVTTAQHENQRTETFSFVIGNKAYMGGGNGFVFTPNSTNNIAFYDLWEYNPATDSWTQKADASDFIGRNMSIAVSINNKGYVGLGCNVDQTINRQSFLEYDPVTDSWTPKSSFPTAFTTDAGAFVLGSELYVVGGVRFNPVTLSNQVYKYDPVADSWSQLSNFNGNAIAGEIAASTGNKAFVSTGYNSSLIARHDIWELTVATGVDENNFSDGMNIFPNPASEFIYVNTQKNISRIEIYDMTGRLMIKESNFNSGIDVRDFPLGIYNVKIIFRDGVEKVCQFVKID